MIQILSTNDLSTTIRRIIKRARERIVLISPFLDEKSDIFEYLYELKQKSYSVPIFIITRTPSQVYYNKESHKKAIAKFSEIDNCYVHYCLGLHTKCYFNEEEMIITSLNLLSSSEEHNFELGTHFDQKERIYGDALQEINEICKEAVPEMNRINNDGTFSKQPLTAFCIHSGKKIAYQDMFGDKRVTKRYIEYSTYKKLPEYLQDEDSTHQYCHGCGKSYKATLKEPLCPSCKEFMRCLSLNNFN